MFVPMGCAYMLGLRRVTHADGARNRSHPSKRGVVGLGDEVACHRVRVAECRGDILDRPRGNPRITQCGDPVLCGFGGEGLVEDCDQCVLVPQASSERRVVLVGVEVGAIDDLGHPCEELLLRIP